MRQESRWIGRWIGASLLAMPFFCAAATAQELDLKRALEVTQSMQQRFWDQRGRLYNDPAGSNRAAAMWDCGIALSADLAAARYDPATYGPVVTDFLHSMDRYWDFKEAIPGYEPFPTNGSGHDKYYDDNAWIAIALVEAYDMDHKRQTLDRARQTNDFVLSGWDDKLGGGIWWQETHRSQSKNTCENGPGAVACLRLAQDSPPAQAAELRKMAQRIVDWTVTNLQNSDGLFADNESITGQIRRGELTYNTALMIRAELGLYRATGNRDSLAAAERMSKAADRFVDSRTGRYHDQVKWSHLLVEADLAMYRTDKNPHWLARARGVVNGDYEAWQKKPANNLLDIGGLCRELWLLYEANSPAGHAFWTRIDGPIARPRASETATNG